MQSSHDGRLIVAVARTWVGTPYHHQAQLKGVGADCVGVILGIGKESGFMSDDVDERFKAFDGYSRVPNPRRMRQGMELFLEAVNFPTKKIPPVGTIAWLQWRDDLPMHLGIVGEFEGRATLIHSYKQAEKCVEVTLDATWRARINSFWKYPGSAL